MTVEGAFAEQLRDWRTRRGYTQEQAAAWLRVPLRTYQEWEQGRREPWQTGPIRKLMQQARK